MRDHIVAIARQNGSGGRDVGRMLAGRLGVPCYDTAVVERAAEIAGVTVDDVWRGEERPRDSGLFFGGIAPTNPIYSAQCQAIRELASGGPCVFVGRNADSVLSGTPGLVTVFIHAPLESRISRSMERNGISYADARRRVTEKDSARGEYCRRYTSRLWGASENYDLSVSTGIIGPEGAVELIMDYIRRVDGE